MFIRRLVSSRTVSFVRYYCQPSVKEETVPKFSKEGDAGESKVAGLVLPKCEYIFDAIGATEELQSYIGYWGSVLLKSTKHRTNLKPVLIYWLQIGPMFGAACYCGNYPCDQYNT